MSRTLELLPCDLLFTQSPGLISRGIRWATTDPGESPAQISHVGVVVQAGQADKVAVIEALRSGVVRRPFWASAEPNKPVAVYRPLNLTQDQMWTILGYLGDRIGQRYGYGKIALHLLRSLVRKATRGRVSGDFLTRASWIQDQPICSYLAGHAFAAAGLSFDVDAEIASPDDQWDFVNRRTDLYKTVWRLHPLV